MNIQTAPLLIEERIPRCAQMIVESLAQMGILAHAKNNPAVQRYVAAELARWLAEKGLTISGVKG